MNNKEKINGFDEIEAQKAKQIAIQDILKDLEKQKPENNQ